VSPLQTLDYLIGREHELETLSRVLAARQPALVVIGGSVGMGKSALLGAMRQRADDDGWYLLPGNDEVLEVHEGMSVSSLRGALEGLVAYADRGTERKSFTDPAAPAPSDGASQSPRAAVTSLLAGTRLTSASWRYRAVGGLLDSLRQLAPVMIGLDVRMPDRSVWTWLTAKLWPAVRAADVTTVIVAVVVDKEDERALAGAATTVLHLGPLDVGAVRSYLETVTSALSPSELDGYAEKIRHDPGLLSSFSRVLPLAVAPATSPPPLKNGGEPHL
jgi:hypothetical protein